MPKFIQKNDVFRLFSYGFYDRLNERLKNYVPMNIAFLVDGTKYAKKIGKKKLKYFTNNRQQTYNTIVERNNIHTLEQGTFLILDPFVHVEDKEDTILGKKVNRYMLLAQFFTEDGEPVFTSEATHADIKRLTPMHPDNVRLVLALMETVQGTDTTEVNNTLRIIQAPEKWLDELVGPWEYLQNEKPPAE